jgi:Tfp pilus assembly protein PilO
MSTLENLWDYVRGNLFSVLPIAIIAIMGLGYTLFVASSILPRWSTRNELAAQMAAAQEAMAEAQAQQMSPEVLQAQIASMQARLHSATDVFLSESQVAEILDRLYQYADESGVKIVDLQSQPSPQTAKEGEVGVAPLYDVRVFRLQVAGSTPLLMDFVARIREASAPGVVITNLNIGEQDGYDTLTMDILFYVSPYASDGIVTEPLLPTAPVPSSTG